MGQLLEMTDDAGTWGSCPVSWLWIYDKVIVARQQKILAAPAGIPVPAEGWYVVRPITNIRMMGRGARKMYLRSGDEDLVPDGYFWSEVLTGPHLSVDYHWGKPELTVQGWRDDPERLDRFSRWTKLDQHVPLPPMLHGLSQHQEWINVEYIGDRVIEVHLRYNDDFRNHDSDEIIPVWRDEPLCCIQRPEGWSWYHSPAGDRLGFWIKGKIND